MIRKFRYEDLVTGLGNLIRPAGHVSLELGKSRLEDALPSLSSVHFKLKRIHLQKKIIPSSPSPLATYLSLQLEAERSQIVCKRESF